MNETPTLPRSNCLPDTTKIRISKWKITYLDKGTMPTSNQMSTRISTPATDI